MKASLSARRFEPAFLSFAEMGQVVRENHLYSDKALGLTGTRFREVAVATSLQNAEEAVNRLVYGVRNAPKPKEARQSIREAVSLAKDTESPHQLHYLASMFINHPEVIRAVAKNPRINEQTQQVILNDAKLGKDPRVLRNLGDNPAIGPRVMTHILNTADDAIALHMTARNAVRKAQQSNGPDTPYVKICDELADKTFDPAVRLVALAGARSHDVLRKIVRTRDVVLGARELEAVADNPYTPKDLLAEMANTSGPRQAIQAMFGITVGQRAARTLSRLSHPEMDRDAVSPH